MTSPRSSCQVWGVMPKVDSKRLQSSTDQAGRRAGVGYCAVAIGETLGCRAIRPAASPWRNISTAKSYHEQAGTPL